MSHPARPATQQGGTTIPPDPTTPPDHQPQRPYHTDGDVTLYVGDAVDVLAGLPAASIDSIVTSPPYWGLRDYGTAAWVGGDPGCRHSAGRGGNVPQTTQPAVDYPASAAHRGGDPAVCRRCAAVRLDRQYGLEPTPEAYVEHLRAVFAQLARVLVPTGTVWLNLGDCYASNSNGYHVSRPGKANQPTYRPRPGLANKNLVGMPWRVAFALQDDGWILRNTIIWNKPNAMPESVRDRLSCRYEVVFLLVRQPRYYFNLDAIREPLARPDALDKGIVIGGRKGRHAGVGARARRRGHTVYGKYADTSAFLQAPGQAMRPGRRHTAAHPRGKNPGDVWTIPTRPLREAHFAAFPIDIPLRCIKAGSPPGGRVLDPFSGAATTGLAARQLGRTFTGIDLRAEFHDIGIDRLARATPANPAGSDQNADGRTAAA
jgi:DNA modification methylase